MRILYNVPMQMGKRDIAPGEKKEARKSLDSAKGMIQKMGYHRRDREVEEIEEKLEDE